MQGYLTYWKEIVKRDNPTGMQREFQTMVNVVGMAKIYELVIEHYEGTKA